MIDWTPETLLALGAIITAFFGGIATVIVAIREGKLEQRLEQNELALQAFEAKLLDAEMDDEG